jgi:hypothetical protein
VLGAWELGVWVTVTALIPQVKNAAQINEMTATGLRMLIGTSPDSHICLMLETEATSLVLQQCGPENN